MKTVSRLACWCILGTVLGLASIRQMPDAAPILSPPDDKTLGITPALQRQNEGATLVDLRVPSPQNLPIPHALRTVKNTREKVIVIGEASALRKIENPARIIGIVPPWTLQRATNLPRDWEITPSQLTRAADAYQIVDVREADEWARSHIPRSRQISMFEIETALSKSTPTAVFCLTGHRSAFVVRRLRERGFNNVVSVRGGWLDWRAQKRELVAN